MEIVKVIVWPLVVLILGVFVAFLFKRPFQEFLHRLSGFKASSAGLELNASTAAAIQQRETKTLEIGLGETHIAEAEAQTSITTSLSPELKERLEEIRRIDTSPLVVEQEKLIRNEIVRLNIASAELPDLLIRQLAVFQLQVRAETIYRTIYGSQIALLKAANSFGPGSKEEISRFYENAKAKFPELYSKFSFDNYLAFLTAQALLVATPDGKFAITLAGKEFLKWMIDVNANENKAF